MKRIAVVGSGEATAAANLIGTMLQQATGWKVGVLDCPRQPQSAFDRLEATGCECAVAALPGARQLSDVQVGVFTGLDVGQEGALAGCDRLVLNLDDPRCRRVAERHRGRGLTYSERRDSADLTAKNLRLFPNRMEFVALTWGDIRRVRLPVWGGYDIYQGLAALGCGLSLGLDLGSLASCVERVPARPGRMEPFALSRWPYQVILDSARTLPQLEGLLLSLQAMAEGGGQVRVVLDRITPDALALCRSMGVTVVPGSDREEAMRHLLEHSGAQDVLAVTGVHEPGSRQDERRYLRLWQSQQETKKMSEKTAPEGGEPMG